MVRIELAEMELDMTCVLLDIGAGSKSFVRSLKIRNLFTPTLAFCGEPDWGFFNFLTVSPTSAKRLIKNGSTGTYRIRSEYAAFAFNDASLDVVTCNAPHPPFFLPIGMEKELERCVKPGGIFFYAYPSPGFYHPLPLSAHGFTQIVKSAFSEVLHSVVRLKGLVPKGVPSVYPPSPDILDAQWVRWKRSNGFDAETHSSSYTYFMCGVWPTYEVWQRK